MRRAALLVAACLLLAGCSGLAPTADASGDDNETAGGAEDRLGWENGYAANDSIAVDASDGLNETERERAVSRAMARVEEIRGLEFEEDVNVTVVSRENFSAGGGGEQNVSFQRFDNAKFEALFLVGGANDSLAEQGQNRDQTVAGFYSPSRGDIVIVSDARSPQFDGERTLAHELVHALQDQHFDLSTANVSTRDAYNGRNGLVEGDARAVELAYLERCGEEWACLPRAESDGGSSGSGGSVHLGLYILEYFPYSDGPGFVSALRDGGDWTPVNDAFDDPPTSSTSVIYPERYDSFEPREVDLTDRNSGDWERVRPPGRTDAATMGQSALVSMFAYTLYDDYNETAVVDPQTFLNTEGTSVNRTDPFDYDLPMVRGWTGDRMHVYHDGTATGYVWRLTWDSPADARRFAAGYEALLDHWGGTEQGDGVWRITGDSPFRSATDVSVEGDTVTIVNAPTVDDLDDVRRGAG